MEAETCLNFRFDEPNFLVEFIVGTREEGFEAMATIGDWIIFSAIVHDDFVMLLDRSNQVIDIVAKLLESR